MRFVRKCQSKGKVTFFLDELCAATALTKIAAKSQLLRLEGMIVQVSPQRDFYVIVNAEQTPMGIPPIDWWLDEYFQYIDRPYYVALLSAAQIHGASHQSVQKTQVIVDRPVKDIHVGRMTIEFFVKKDLLSAKTMEKFPAYARLLISTPEETGLDLIRYSSRIGGVARAVATIKDMLGQFSVEGLNAVLDSKIELSVIQRMGFILEWLGKREYACVLLKFIKDIYPRKRLVLLEPESDGRSMLGPARSLEVKWSVINNADLKELS